ncbi:MAG: glycosyltransferase family 2 protein [Candidatus Sericytochromatia bacterium]
MPQLPDPEQTRSESPAPEVVSQSPARVLVVIFSFNEGPKLGMTLERFPAGRDYDLMVMDDGSTDGSTDQLTEEHGLILLRHSVRLGVGSGMQSVFHYAISQHYEVVIPMAGNSKDSPDEIPRLLEQIAAGADFVQGSRYLPGGKHGGMPVYRRLATQFVHPLLFSLLTRRRITDSTNGFRALRVSMLQALKPRWDQSWLKQYELEPYLFYQAIRQGYRVVEVPVSKFYPPRELGYTKMKPITGWWSILRPLVFLLLRMRR